MGQSKDFQIAANISSFNVFSFDSKLEGSLCSVYFVVTINIDSELANDCCSLMTDRNCCILYLFTFVREDFISR